MHVGSGNAICEKIYSLNTKEELLIIALISEKKNVSVVGVEI